MESNQLNNVPNEDAVIELLTLTCKVDKWGNKAYYNKEGLYHRIHGPAFINTAGTQIWYKDGMLHRDNGPAAIFADGKEQWYKNGRQIRNPIS